MLGIDVFNYGHVINHNNHIFKGEGDEAEFATGDSVKIAQHCLNDGSFTDGWVEELSVGSHSLSGAIRDNISAIYVPEGFKATLIKEDEEVGAGEVVQDEFLQVDGPRAITCLVNEGWNDKATKVVVEKMPTCADKFRVNDTSDFVCGACMDGYTEDTATGLCVADSDGIDENILVIGGLALVGVLAVSLLG